jgi:hypothetical protein
LKEQGVVPHTKVLHSRNSSKCTNSNTKDPPTILTSSIPLVPKVPNKPHSKHIHTSNPTKNSNLLLPLRKPTSAFPPKSIRVRCVTLVKDDRIDSDTGSGFWDDGAIRSVEFGDFGSVDDVDSAGASVRVVGEGAAGAGADACNVRGGKGFCGDDLWGGWGGGFFWCLLRIASCDLGVSAHRLLDVVARMIGLVMWGDQYDAIDLGVVAMSVESGELFKDVRAQADAAKIDAVCWQMGNLRGDVDLFDVSASAKP